MAITISGAGSISGSGSITAQTGFSRTLSITTVNLNDVGYDAQFSGNTMFFNYSFPPYLTDHMTESTPYLITVSGLINGDEAMNGQTFTVMRVSQTIVDVNGSLAAFIATFNLAGQHAWEKYDHTWNWNS